MQNENVNASDIYVIGDSEKSDLLPARQLNMNAILIKSASEVEKVISQIIK